MRPGLVVRRRRPVMAKQEALPADPFKPFVPSSDAPWNVHRANHLARRTGFGVTHETLRKMLSQKPGEAVDELLSYDPSDDPFDSMLAELEGFINLSRSDQVQSYWLHRMLQTARPMQEKIALFWHNHFATGSSKVGNGRHMHNQIELFRRKGLGSFRDLLIEVGRDPAMLIWLDGQHNRKGKANENYGREVMELFSLGIGNYTEEDVREIARAFTGWQVSGEAGVLRKNLFDDGEKTILGETGPFDSESAVDLLLRQPAASTFIARKLLREFIHPHPKDEHIGHYAKRLVAHQWEIKPVVREMLSSRLFFSDWSYRSKIKSPVEFVVGAIRALGGRASTDFARDQCGKMGQTLLNPPDVAGWKGEEAWINANTVLVRFNFGMAVAMHRGGEFVRRPKIETWLKENDIQSADRILDHYIDILVDGRIPPEARSKLLDYMNRDRKNEPKDFQFNGDWVNTKVKGIVHLLLTLPEAQLA